ncbi:tyrosine-type recombinase/integrase [Streptomyces hygroscopicus]|uniref:tyrosine-type recombinase/integrase n=1 Tax=Streptomyces hygroscopicus TaxID=1912 RepID=UPI00369F4F1D
MPLPPVHFHDLRHGAATMLIGAGVDDKLMSEALGPASVSYTKGGYAGVAEDAALKISAFIPGQKRSAAVGAITVPSGREP